MTKMEELNDEFFWDSKFWRVLEHEFFASWRKIEHEFVEEVKAENPDWVNDRKIDYLVWKAAGIKLRLDKARWQWEKDKKNGAGIMERMTNWYLLSDDGLEKKLKRLWVEIKMRLQGYEYGDTSPERVELARQVAIEDVYPELPAFIRCIDKNHIDENPSLYIKKFAYCFSCHKKWDVLGFVMEKENLKFPEAVNFILDGRDSSAKQGETI
jgi:hypothetical protein